MNYSNYRLTLDVHDISSNVVVKVKKGDNTRRLCISLTENGKVYQIADSCKAWFMAKKPNGGHLCNACEIENNTILYVMTNNTTNAVGIVDSEVRLVNEEKGDAITSPSFTILVEDTTVNDDDVLDSSNEATALMELVKETAELKNEVESMLDGFDTYETDEYGFAISDEDGNVAFALSNEGEVDYMGKGSGGGVAFDFRKCGLPVLYLIGNASAMTKEKNEVTLEYKLTTRKAPFYNGGVIASGTCKCKWQGSSSVRNEYAKHNFTIKFDTAFEATAAVSKRSGDPADNQESEFGSKRERKWGEQKKYCLKANWIDPSGVRNVVNAKLWGDIVRSRATSKAASAAPDQLTNAPNCGAIDGFPCIIAINGEFEGLYTFNIPKEGWLFGMGESLTEYVVSGEENGLAACGFYAPATFIEDANGKVDYSVEYTHDDASEDDVIASFNNAINAVKNAPNSAEWESAVADYFDIDSAIDYYIFICCISAHDNLRRNTLYATYDGVKWFMSAYDLDTTYGYNPYGTCLFPVKTERTQFAEAATGSTRHCLFELIYKYSKDKLKARYKELRSTVLSDENVWYMLANFANRIPRAIYNLDADKFADEPDYDKYPMPATATANVENYMHYYRMHCALLDKEMEV